MSENRQYTCPECGHGGAHPKDSPPPLCHRCNYKVTMLPSQNGKIINPPMRPSNLTDQERADINDILRRRANEIAGFKENAKAMVPSSVELALSREIDRLRDLAGKLVPPEQDPDDPD